MNGTSQPNGPKLHAEWQSPGRGDPPGTKPAIGDGVGVMGERTATIASVGEWLHQHGLARYVPTISGVNNLGFRV